MKDKNVIPYPEDMAAEVVDGAAVDSIGKALFGRPARLALGMYLVQTDAPVFLSEIARALDRFAMSAISQELKHFARHGLLQRCDVEGTRRVYYLRTDSPWWVVFEAAADVLRGGAPGGNRDRSVPQESLL